MWPMHCGSTLMMHAHGRHTSLLACPGIRYVSSDGAALAVYAGAEACAETAFCRPADARSPRSSSKLAALDSYRSTVLLVPGLFPVLSIAAGGCPVAWVVT